MLEKAIIESDAGGAVMRHETPRAAYAAARRLANENDRIVAFGSFLTVADVMQAIQTERRSEK
jgi:dihydrofolate synthase/folylpolyglutamate synthase